LSNDPTLEHQLAIPTDVPTQSEQLKTLDKQLEHSVTSRDLYPLRKQLRNMIQRLEENFSISNQWQKWRIKVNKSLLKVEKRAQQLPQISYPDLPVSARAEEIFDLIKRHQVVIIAGETGSGKTTQLPKICLQAGRGVRGLIGHTQPRRIAARSVASRIAEELQVELGQGVGYQVRFSDQTSKDGLIKLMTDGILLGEIQNNRFLTQYDTIIIDEAHERSLNIDFLLGYLKELLPKRKDLKLIITSATIDVEKFSQHFNDAPIVEVSGRSYPVDIVYADNIDASLETEQLVVDTVKHIDSQHQQGDILVFLSGEREIREIRNALRRAQIPNLEVIPLYARLSLAEQRKIFAPHRGRRVVLSTNVAETSLTVPGIGYVIDTGRARVSRYSYRTKVQRLPIEAISKASANQRAGRCGRISNGVCYRLYAEEDFNTRSEFTDPEILRTNLAAVILQMLHLRIGDIREFSFVDKPDSRLINDGFKLLQELQAVDANGELTVLGKKLVTFPLDPRLARMLIEAAKTGALSELLIITSGLSIQDPRERPADKQQAADQAHKRWQDTESDFLSLLKLWQHFEEQRQALSRNQFSRYCKANFISPLRMREWRDLRQQIHSACRALKLTDNQQPADYASIHRALLSGLLGQVATKEEKWQFLGTRNRKLFIFPGSGLSEKPPKWIVAGSLMETTKQYALNVAKIDPQWLQSLAAHIVKKTYSEPFYHRKSGQVMAKERQTLFGLTVVEGKNTVYGQIAPAEARTVFIQQALVELGYQGAGSFIEKNQSLLEELLALENRFRRRDLLAEQKVIYSFYDQRVPEGIYNLPAFEKWRKKAEKKDPALLIIDRELLLLKAVGAYEEAQFPQQVHYDGIEFSLRYTFEPGHREDGVSVVVPLPILHQMPRFYFEWLVPGMLRDKCIALIKTLPKQVRRHFVPVPDYVDRILLRVAAQDRPLTEVLTQELTRLTGVQIGEGDWREESLDTWYQMNFVLEDEDGKMIAMERSLKALQKQFKQQVASGIKQADKDTISRHEITEWDFDELPSEVTLKRGNITVKAWPSLRDCGDWVNIELCDNPLSAEQISVSGQLRLALIRGRDQVKYLNKHLLKDIDLALKAAGLPDRMSVVNALISASFQWAIFTENQLVRDRAVFQVCLQNGLPKVVDLAQQKAALIESTLPLLHQCRKQLTSLGLQAVYAKADIERQIERLFSVSTLDHIQLDQLRQYPRYVRAIQIRLDKLATQASKDRQAIDQLEAFLQPLANLRTTTDSLSRTLLQAMDDFDWSLEEFRVSLFAQQLKTRRPISAQRLQKQWNELYEALRRSDLE
jgi:ATP-dependent helicase HrpA